MVSFLFPGQGSQEPGMGKALAEAYPEARRAFEEADEALGEPLSRVCFEGTAAELMRTEVTQPAILATSVATLRALRSERPGLSPRFVAGHSLGEWSALVAAGALSFGDALRLVRERGRLMQRAVPEGEGAMAAVLGLDRDAIEDVCQRTAARLGQVVVAANFNAREQTVISGHRDAVTAAGAALEAAGARKVSPLPVSAPFHSPLMAPAAEGLAAALATIPLVAPAPPVIANVTAAPEQDPERIRGLLVQQVTAPVRWVECVERLVAGGEGVVVEIGPGRVLGNLAKRIDRALVIHATATPELLARAIAALP